MVTPPILIFPSLFLEKVTGQMLKTRTNSKFDSTQSRRGRKKKKNKKVFKKRWGRKERDSMGHSA